MGEPPNDAEEAIYNKDAAYQKERDRVCAPVRARVLLPWRAVKSAKGLTFEQWGIISSSILALATVVLALGVMWQIRVMQEDQRPWLGVGHSQIVPSADAKSMYFVVEISNAGKSPALNVSMTVADWNTKPDKTTFPITPCSGADCRAINAEVIPGTFIGIVIPKFNQLPLPIIGDSMNIIIRIDYQDAHGNPFSTGVCRVYSTARDPTNAHGLIVDEAACTKDKSNYAT